MSALLDLPGIHIERRKLVLNQEMAEAQHFYQAIGELWGTLVVAEEGTKFLETAEARYRAFIPLKVEQKYQGKYQGQQVYWRVYPLIEQELAFQVVSVSEQPQKGHGQFILQGDWVELGQLQIWRNTVAGSVNAYNWQPRLLPISWSNAPSPDAAFWQFQAELVDGTLKVVTAAGPSLNREGTTSIAAGLGVRGIADKNSD